MDQQASGRREQWQTKRVRLRLYATPFEGRTFYLAYHPANGEVTKRRVIAKGVRSEPDDLILEAYCLLQRAPRSFRASAISELVDLRTGQVISDVQDFLSSVPVLARAQPRPRLSTRPEPDNVHIILFTGTLETMTRDEAEATAKALGMKIARSVTEWTDFLVAGTGSENGTKRRRAAQLGVRIIDEAAWRRIAGL